ncbi:Vsb1p ASCRUDRAFT_31821, partial [Ascoidea rubescens DSM 1968]
LPPVLIGLLLNILDGLSYGIILFPNVGIFSNLGPAGLSMFYISCIVSQLVYTFGGSGFPCSIGSEMIEITPFIHTIALNILHKLSPSHNSNNIPQELQDKILATTVVATAISCILTGLTFFILGKFRLGQLIGFFPRHILIGCIGGVGYFLIMTGFEVTSKLPNNIHYNLETLKLLFSGLYFVRWSLAVLVTVLLILLQKFNKVLSKSAIFLPCYFILIFLLFHLLVLIIPSWSLSKSRELGFVFDIDTSTNNSSWYSFYSLYKFSKVDWLLILQELPTMLALTFFGILHVPINIPALAVSTKNDEIDIDKELIGHGVSNILSGCLGSVQNYLVYSNSLLFIRSGAESKLPSFLLAVGTVIIMFIGPVLIKFIPVCVVGALIFLLGYELMIESLIDSYGRLSKFEYTTVIIIVFTMGIWDFVYGIIIGILLACISFVVDNARRNPITHIYSGVIAKSTVFRNQLFKKFLRNVGDQIYLMKLEGNIFFGTIGAIEEEIRARFEVSPSESGFSSSSLSKIDTYPSIRYLILDFKNILSIDYTAAEGFTRIKNLVKKHNAYLIISSISNDSQIYRSLNDVGLLCNNEEFDGCKPVQLFDNLNSALEWCENEFLSSYYKFRQKKLLNLISPIISAINPMLSMADNSSFIGSPRQTNLFKAATQTISEEFKINNQIMKELTSVYPLSLIMSTFYGLSSKPESFWIKLLPYLRKERIPRNTIVYTNEGKENNEGFMFIIESGLIKVNHSFAQGTIDETFLPKTCLGNLGVSSPIHENDEIFELLDRKYQIITSSDCVVWRINFNDLLKLKKIKSEEGIIGVEIINELLEVQMKIFFERFENVTAYALISS